MPSNDGLKHKYNIQHADGTSVDPDGVYFVLRLDYHPGCDKAHIKACKNAAIAYAEYIRPHLPQLAADLLGLAMDLSGPACTPREFAALDAGKEGMI